MADANILKPFVLAWEGGYVFQSTPLREGRPTLSTRLDDALDEFQSTPLREGRLFSCILLIYSYLFSSFRESFTKRGFAISQ